MAVYQLDFYFYSFFIYTTIQNEKDSQQQRPAAIIHIVQKYNISQATVSRLLKQFNSQNNSLNEQSISEQSEQEEYSKSEQNNQEQSQNEQNDQEQSVQSAEEQIQNIEQSIQVQESLIEHHNNSLIEYLNEKEQPQEEQKQIIEQKSYQQQRNQQKNNNYYKKYQKDEQQQQIEQVQISQESDQQIQNEMNNQMIRIHKLMQYFKNESCIQHLIGANEGQQRQFSDNLYKKDLKQLSDIYVKLQFELMFSRSNDFMENTIETTAEFLEQLLLVANINVINCFQEMKQDEEFQFHMKMLICKSSCIPSSKQVIFMKFIKNYYQKYQQNKQSFNSEIKQNLDVKTNQSLLDKFKSL